MISLLLANWKLVAIGILSALVMLFYNLWQRKVDEFNVFKAGVEAVGRAAEAEKKRVEETHAKTTKEIKDAIPKQIAAARSNAVKRYIASLPTYPGGSGLSCAPNSAGGTDATSKESMVGGCRAGFIEDAAQDATTIGQWQDWARQIGFPVK